ncbi:MAG: hypothetical protein ACTHN8_10595, partial [Angustibacter sp.]
MSRLTYLWTATICGVALAACSAAGPGEAGSGVRPSATSTSVETATSTSTASPTPSPTTPAATSGRRSAVSLRCGGDDAPDARLLRLKAPGGAVLTAFDVGRGTTAAVLLHQTNGGGFCGWWPYASWLVSSHPVRAIGLDLCGYGGSQCSESLGDNPRRQVAAALRWATAHGA